MLFIASQTEDGGENGDTQIWSSMNEHGQAGGGVRNAARPATSCGAPTNTGVSRWEEYVLDVRKRVAPAIRDTSFEQEPEFTRVRTCS